MIYKIISILLLIIIAFISSNYCQQLENETAVCDLSKNITTNLLNKTSSPLQIDGNVGSNGSQCVWIIDLSAPKAKIHLDISKLSIGIHNTLKITANDGKDSLLYELQGFELPGVILTDKSNITVTLSLSNETIDPQFEVIYSSSNTVEIENLDRSGRYVFAHYNKSLSLTTDFELIFKTNYGNKILINFETFELNGGNVLIENAVNVDNIKPISTKPAFLLSNDQNITLKINAFKTNDKTTGIALNYEIVDRCSNYVVIKGDVLDTNYAINMELTNGTDLQSLSSFKCFTLFEHEKPDAKLLLDLHNFDFMNSFDTIIVRDGDSYDSKVLAIIESQFLNNYWKQLYLYSTSNKLWILYDSPLLINKTTPITPTLGVIPKSQGGNIRLNNSTTNLVLKPPHPNSYPLPVVYNIEADEGSQVVIDFRDKALPGNASNTFITIYEIDTRGGRPLMNLKSGDYPPDIMASNTNLMRIEFNQTVDFEVDILQVKKGCHSTVSDTSTSYSLSGCSVNGEQLCSWVVPKRDTKGTYILQFSHLNLPNKTDRVFIEKLDSQKSSVLNINGTFETTTFPDLNLNPSYSYVLYTIRQCPPKSTDNTSLLGVSLLYVNDDLSIHQINISDGLTIASQNYPNYYSIGSDHLWKIEGQSGQKALLTFTDIDLIPDHKLYIIYPNKSETITDKILSNTTDYLVNLPLLLNLSSQSIGTKEPLSARGFSANLTSADCGDSYIIDVKEEFTISTTMSSTSKCIWTLTIKPSDLKVLNLLNFTLKFGKDVTQKSRPLIIYDSNSLRDNQINLTDYNDSHYVSSTDSIIIIYSVKNDSKKDLNLTLNFNTAACDYNWCSNSKRCILPQFLCNGINECGDWSDEKDCNSTGPTPQPQPQPKPQPTPSSGGVNGWVVLFVICPLCIGLGAAAVIFGPNLLVRVRRGRYREFQDFSEVS